MDEVQGDGGIGPNKHYILGDSTQPWVSQDDKCLLEEKEEIGFVSLPIRDPTRQYQNQMLEDRMCCPKSKGMGKNTSSLKLQILVA